MIALLPDLSVAPCGFATDKKLRIGRTLKEDIRTIIGKKSLKIYKASLERISGVCTNCMLYKIHKGDCRVESIANYKKFGSPGFLCQEVYEIGLLPKNLLYTSSVRKNKNTGGYK